MKPQNSIQKLSVRLCKRAQKVPTLIRKSAVLMMTLLMFAATSLAETITVIPNSATTGSISSSYVATVANFTYEEIDWAINNWNPSSFQVRGNQASESANFLFYNTTAIPGKITKVSITMKTAGTTFVESNIGLVTGSSAQTGSAVGGTNPTKDATTLSWSLNGEDTFFKIGFHTKGATSGTANITNIIIEYETAPKSTIPTVGSANVEGITATGASLHVENVSNGGAEITAAGFEYNTENNFTSGVQSINDQFDQESIIAELTNLTSNTTYYVRAYATNEKGTAYSDTVNFTTKHLTPVISNLIVNEDNNTATSILFHLAINEKNTTLYYIVVTEEGTYSADAIIENINVKTQALETESLNDIVIEGLTESTTYHVYMVAKNTDATGDVVKTEATTKSASTPALQIVPGEELNFDTIKGKTQIKTVHFTGTNLENAITVALKFGDVGFVLEETTIELTPKGDKSIDSIIKITYTAQSETVADTLLVTSADFSSVTRKVALVGHTHIPVLTMDSIQVRSGEVVINTSKVITLKVGAEYLTDDITLAIEGDMFTIDSTTLIKPENGTLTNKVVTLTYTPTTIEAHHATLRLTSEHATTLEIALSGEGIEAPVIPSNEVTDIAAFKATSDETNSTVYTISGDVIFVWRNGDNMYIKDATGGLLIYDRGSAVISTIYEEGDTIRGGIKGSLTIYNGVYELIPTENTVPGIAGVPIEPIKVSMQELLNNFSTYEAQLIRLDSIAFETETTLQESRTAASANTNITQNGSTMILRNNYNNLTGYTTNPDNLFNVIGFAVPFNADRQIAPRNIDDIEDLGNNNDDDASTQDQECANIHLYPNPVTDMLYVETESNVVSLMVYNMSGQRVVEQVGQNQINVSNLSRGVYAIKITLADGSIVMGKVVKQ